MGDRLIGAIRPIKTDVNEILAEVKALRNQASLAGNSNAGRTSKSADPFYIALRFLLEERNKDYTRFVESIFGDLDIAAHQIQSATTVEDLIEKADGKVEIVEDDFDFQSFWQNEGNRKRMRTATHSMGGSWALTDDKVVYLSKSMRMNLNDKQAALAAKLK